MAADGGTRLRERLVDPADHLAGGARRLDHHDPLPGQQLVQQLGRDRLRELVVAAICRLSCRLVARAESICLRSCCDSLTSPPSAVG